MILNANNVSNAGFSSAAIGELVVGNLMMFGGGAEALAGMLGGGGGGFTESMSGGVNASHEFGNNNWLRSSYFYNELDNVRNSTVQRQALFGSDVASVLDQSSSSESTSGGHRLNLNGQLALSPGHQLRIRVNANLRSSLTSRFTTQETHNAAGGMLNSAVTDYFTDGDDLGGDAQLTWRKRLNESGRSVVAEFRTGISDYDYGGGTLLAGERSPWRTRRAWPRGGDAAGTEPRRTDLEQPGAIVADAASGRRPLPGGLRPEKLNERGPG